MEPKRHRYFFGITAALLTAISWGVEPVFLNLALKDLPPVFVSWFRFVFVVLILACIFARGNQQFTLLLRRPPWLLLIAALVLAGNYFGFVKGIELSGPAVATLLLQTGPLFLAIFGIVIFHEKMTGLQVSGVFLSFVGFLIFYFDRRSFYDPGTLISPGDLVVIIAGLCWGTYAALQKKLSEMHNPQHLNVLILGFASLLLLPGLLDLEFSGLHMSAVACLLGSGICNLAAYWGLAEALRNAPAALVSIIIVLNPFITLGLSKLVEFNNWSWMPREPVGLPGYLGALLAVSGLLIVARKQA